MSQAPLEHDFWEKAAQGDTWAMREAIWGEGPDAWDRRVYPCVEAILPALLPAAGAPGATVLDLGCGVGRLTIPIARALPEATLIGVDIAPTMLAKAKDAAAEARVRNVVWLPCDGRDLPHVGRLDAAFCMVVFQHVPADATRLYIAQVAAALRRGGRFRFQFVEGTAAEWMSHHLSESFVREACEAAGLDVVDIDRGLMYPEWTWMTTEKR